MFTRAELRKLIRKHPAVASWNTTELLIGIELIVPDKHKLGTRPPSEVAKARIRLVIESVFSTLKRQTRLEDHLAKTLPGLAQTHRPATPRAHTRHAHQHNLNRPPRALAAYDGR